MDTAEARRAAMVEHQIAARGVSDRRVLDAMRTVPREAFVSDEQAGLAYQDNPLPIESGQTISQPYIVAHMIEAAGIKPGDRVLEIGGGSGYAAAVMSRIAALVFAVERHAGLAELARDRFERLGYRNIVVRAGDGGFGWPEEAPFDAILVAAAAPRTPQPLRDQLAIGGRLVLPVGDGEHQHLVRLTRRSATGYDEGQLGGVRFVPLIGAHGWAEG